MTLEATDYGPTSESGELDTACPHCGAKTKAHKHLINCWKCGQVYATGKS